MRKKFIPGKLKPEYSLMNKYSQYDRTEGKREIAKQGRNSVFV